MTFPYRGWLALGCIPCAGLMAFTNLNIRTNGGWLICKTQTKQRGYRYLSLSNDKINRQKIK
jgi:hypothetical protein